MPCVFMYTQGYIEDKATFLLLSQDIVQLVSSDKLDRHLPFSSHGMQARLIVAEHFGYFL